MHTRLHLVSAPWANAFTPSIQLGALAAWLDANPVERVEVSTHSAFLSIPLAVIEHPDVDTLAFKDHFGEYAYALLLLEPSELRLSKTTRRALLRMLNRSFAKAGAAPAVPQKTLTVLGDETRAYVRDHLDSRSDSDTLEVYGFTINYDQVTASLFMAREILRRARHPENVLFLFGGMSAADPASVALIRRFGLPAFGVLGEGELKLRQVLSACAAAQTPAEARAATSAVRGVYAFSAPPDLWVKDKAMYEEQLGALRELPIPDFREYYDVLDRHYRAGPARDEAHRHVELPIEGTRGCFAKCTFCGLNYLWSGFRKMPASDVVDRVRRYQQRYPLHRLKFVDNVCDTWAEAFADTLNGQGVRAPAFMELRAHHPETFWTRLALSGLETVQIGIEAVSANVMRLIQKGTTVAQNLLVQKYLFELGIESTSNLITHYPGSTPEDVEETRRVLERISHLSPFTLTRFALAMGSPLFETLSPEQRRALVPRGAGRLPRSLAHYGLEFGYEVPAQLLSDDARHAWTGFHRWYRSWRGRHEGARRPVLTCRSLADGQLRIEDSRFTSRAVSTVYDAEAAAVYAQCHAGKRVAELVSATGLSESRVRAHLEPMLERSHLYDAGGRLLALATRRRDELLINLTHAKPLAKAAARPLPPGAAPVSPEAAGAGQQPRVVC